MSERTSHRIMIYSHDAYGMGNIRRTLAICRQLTANIPGVSILLVTGSPVIHGLRLPQQVDYVKLPCLTRDCAETYSAKYWDLDWKELVGMRSAIILSAVESFRPDLVIVDKKPLGIKREFLPALKYLRRFLPTTRLVLGLRDILDDPSVTVPIWRSQGYYRAIEAFYDQVWIYGCPDVFDAINRYQMPRGVSEKSLYTGYLGRQPAEPIDPRAFFGGCNPDCPTALVMVGGGEDGFPLLQSYVEGVLQGHLKRPFNNLLISGLEMPGEKRALIQRNCRDDCPLRFLEYSDAIESVLAAADVVVSMGGYNTICEILSYGKKAVIIPRVEPVQEQYIRARRLTELGLINMIHPRQLSPALLMQTVEQTYQQFDLLRDIRSKIDLNGLNRVEQLARELLEGIIRPGGSRQVQELCA